jgi:hypothetical protein
MPLSLRKGKHNIDIQNSDNSGKCFGGPVCEPSKTNLDRCFGEDPSPHLPYPDVSSATGNVLEL